MCYIPDSYFCRDWARLNRPPTLLSRACLLFLVFILRGWRKSRTQHLDTSQSVLSPAVFQYELPKLVILQSSWGFTLQNGLEAKGKQMDLFRLIIKWPGPYSILNLSFLRPMVPYTARRLYFYVGNNTKRRAVVFNTELSPRVTISCSVLLLSREHQALPAC